VSANVSLSELWQSASAGAAPGPAADPATLPEPARRFLGHAIAPDARPARAARLRMAGQIKLNDWLPFTAEQVIDWERGFIWQASVKMMGFLPIRGSDRLVDGHGAMRWRLLGLIPVMTAEGADIARSAAGRVAGESLWLPSVLRSHDVTWSATDAGQPKATFEAFGEPIELTLTIDDDGRPTSLWLPRWGNPGGGDFGYATFGALFEDEGTFAGYTVPTRLRGGWHFDGERFDSDGEFFRATITDIQYK
jgi:hypothetical protein